MNNLDKIEWELSFISENDFTNYVKDTIERYREELDSFDIGSFHKRIFQYIDNCHVSDNAIEGGWDIIVKRPEGIRLPKGELVHTIYVEMKNKHNTMNSVAGQNSYIKMQSQLLDNDDCACFLVEAEAKKSQNIKWTTTIKGKKIFHEKIRRVSLDQFYAFLTGQDDAYYKICMVLPKVVEKVVKESGDVKVPNDTVIDELRKVAEHIDATKNSHCYKLNL